MVKLAIASLRFDGQPLHIHILTGTLDTSWCFVASSQTLMLGRVGVRVVLGSGLTKQFSKVERGDFDNDRIRC